MDRRTVLVRDAYDTIAEAWGREREAMNDGRERFWLARFVSSLAGTRVLDLGCGGGAVLYRLAACRLRLTGVDISRAQLARARLACPAARLVLADFADLAFAPACFDGIVAYDCLWHLPAEKHGTLLQRIRRWLVVGAPLLFSVGAPVQPGENYTSLCGAPMYYSAVPRDTTFDFLRQSGFELSAFDDTADRALLVLARAV